MGVEIRPATKDRWDDELALATGFTEVARNRRWRPVTRLARWRSLVAHRAVDPVNTTP